MSLKGKRKPKLNHSHSSSSQEFDAATWKELYEIYRIAKETEGYIPENPFKRVKMVKEEKGVIQAFTEDQIKNYYRFQSAGLIEVFVIT